MIPQAHKIITEITIGYLTIPFPVPRLFYDEQHRTRKSLKRSQSVL